MKTLVIHHVSGTDKPKFLIVGEDQKRSQPLKVVSPFRFQVKDRPDSGLIRELRWYLEEFLAYPFPPNTDHAENVQVALKDWGTQAFNDLFGSRDTGRMFDQATDEGYENLRLQINSDDPRILQWPWEALLDTEATYLAVGSLIERRLNKVRDPIPLSGNLPTDRINILLVTARPYEQDVHYRSISRPLVELIEQNKIPAFVQVLRPPTFANLRAHLAAKKHFYHLIHFDGHGGYGGGLPSGGDTHHTYSGPEGVLVFEDEKGEEDAIKSEQLSGLLREYAIPMMVLNACRSGMTGGGAEDPFASVAAALVKAGIRGVVAMSHSIYVSAAQEFLPAFYRELFNTGELSRATNAGRQQMFAQQKRVCARGRFELKDFIVPVIYQQESYQLPFAKKAQSTAHTEKSDLPEGAQDKENPYGFIGRDRELLKLERAMLKDTPAILIHGLGGVGKTTLARGFVKWLNDTGGMDGGLWLTFIGVKSAEYVINSLGSNIFGPNFLNAKMEEKLTALAQYLRDNRVVIVWDNFEVVAGIAGTYVSANLQQKDRDILLSLLKRIRGGKSKVLITSRSEEEWLGIQRIKVSIGGLQGEEQWEYCDKILSELGLSINREDSGLVDLMKFLRGHPLSMRVILPKLEKKSAGEILENLKSDLHALGPGTEELYGTLRFVEKGIEEDLQPLLIPLAFHEHYIDTDYLEDMAKQVDDSWDRAKIDDFTRSLKNAGLLRNVAGSTHELHPALTGFLRSTLLKSINQESRDKWSRAFVDVMGSLADSLAPRELHEQRFGFHCHGANFHFARSEAERLEMNSDYAALTQSLASYALNTRNFSGAADLFTLLAAVRKNLGDQEGEAAAYHQLGRIGQERREFATAEKWYLNSLEIEERLGNEQHAAKTYHQLGRIAQEQQDFAAAEKQYLRSMAIEEKLDNEQDAAKTYHQLGIIAERQRNFGIAKKWYLKSLAIKEKQVNKLGAALSYGQLGNLAQAQRDFTAAKKWYLKSLAITEILKNEHITSKTNHHLGLIAQEQRDFAAAEKWYLKSLTIAEKQGNVHGAAGTYNQLGILAGLQNDFLGSGKWMIKALKAFHQMNDPHNVKNTVNNFFIFYRKAPAEAQVKMKAMWQEAGLGPFPEMPHQQNRNR